MGDVKDYPARVLLSLGKQAVKDPVFVDRYRYLIDRPEPAISNLIFLYPLRSLFCEQLKIKLPELKEQTALRRKFIAVALSLFNPEYVFNHHNAVRNGLAETLGVLLGTQRDWISQQVGAEKDKINPPERIRSAYQAERAEIKELCDLLYDQLSEIEGFRGDRGCVVVGEMFTGTN